MIKEVQVEVIKEMQVEVIKEVQVEVVKEVPIEIEIGEKKKSNIETQDQEVSVEIGPV